MVARRPTLALENVNSSTLSFIGECDEAPRILEDVEEAAEVGAVPRGDLVVELLPKGAARPFVFDPEDSGAAWDVETEPRAAGGEVEAHVDPERRLAGATVAELHGEQLICSTERTSHERGRALITSPGCSSS